MARTATISRTTKETEINQAQVAEALSEPVQAICEAVMQALEATPPDLAAVRLQLERAHFR